MYPVKLSICYLSKRNNDSTNIVRNYNYIEG